MLGLAMSVLAAVPMFLLEGYAAFNWIGINALGISFLFYIVTAVITGLTGRPRFAVGFLIGGLVLSFLIAIVIIFVALLFGAVASGGQ